jgi:hypothetical protein
MAGETTDWPTGAGNLIIIPMSLIGPPGRVPLSLGLSRGDFLSKLFLSDGTVENNGEEFIRHRPLPPGPLMESAPPFLRSDRGTLFLGSDKPNTTRSCHPRTERMAR